MIPSPWQFVLLALAVYRLWRFCAEDDMPVLVRWRNSIVGAELNAGVWTFRRPTIAHGIQCPWCLGAWLAITATACWWLSPHWTIVACLPFAVSAAVGVAGHFLTG